LGKPTLGYIKGDFFLRAALEELLDVVYVLDGVIVVDDNVIHNASVPWEPIKGFIHASVIML